MTKNNTYTQWRMIGIALSILSLGLAIAWAGFVWYQSQGEKAQGKVLPSVEEIEKK